MAKYIIEHGGDVNALNSLQRTALHCAALTGSISVADVLLQNGADVEAADVNGQRAVHLAVAKGETSFLNHIVSKYKADFHVSDNDGRSPLHLAALTGVVDTVKWLLSKDASQKRQDKNGYTPLHWAAINGEMEVCTVLIDAGTKQEIMAKDNDGNTAIQLASAYRSDGGAILISKALHAECKHLENSNIKGEALQKGTNWPMIIAMQGGAYTGTLDNGMYRLPRSSCSSSSPPTAFLGVRTTLQCWHHHIAHPNESILRRLVSSRLFPLSCNKLEFVCGSCQLGKSHRLPLPQRTKSSAKPFDFIHSNMWGPAPKPSSTG